MRIILDENLPKPLKGIFLNHTVMTVQDEVSSERIVGIRGWLLVLCIWLTIVWPVFTFAKLHEMPDGFMYLFVALIVWSIVSGVFLWLAKPLGLHLACSLLATIIIIHLISIVTFAPTNSDLIVPALLKASIPSAWLAYLQLSKFTRARYTSASQSEIEGQPKSKYYLGWIFSAALVFTAIFNYSKAYPNISYQSYSYPVNSDLIQTNAATLIPPPTISPPPTEKHLPSVPIPTATPISGIMPQVTPPSVPQPPQPLPVRLPDEALRLVKGISVNDKQGILNVHNDSGWTVTSIDFTIVISEEVNRAKHQSFTYKANVESFTVCSPYTNGRFSFQPFDNDALVKGLHYYSPRVDWEITSASGLRTEGPNLRENGR